MKRFLAALVVLSISLFALAPQANAQASKRPCPVFKLAQPPAGCKYEWKVENGCRVPHLVCGCRHLNCPAGQKCVQVTCVKAPCPPVCQPACPVFKLAAPPAGCQYHWKIVNGCRHPHLVCGCQHLRCPSGQVCKQVTCVRAPCPPVCAPRK